MGFAIGGGCSSQSSLRHFQSPCCYLPHPFPGTTRRIAFVSRPRKIRIIIAAQNQENPLLYNGSCARRVIMFIGFALIPFLGIGIKAIKEGFASENIEVKEEEEEEQNGKVNSSKNPILSLLNVIGILGSGILAALFVSTKKVKSRSDAIIECMELQLEEKNAAIASLEKKIEMELVKEKETWSHAMKKATGEQKSLANRLALANNTITSMGKEMLQQKRLVDELSSEVDDLEVQLREATSDRKELEELLKNKMDSLSVCQEQTSLLSSELKEKEDSFCIVNSMFCEKDRAINELGSAREELRNQLTILKLQVKELKGALVNKEKEMEWKSEVLEKLEQELKSSIVEKDEILKKLDNTVAEYKHFKSITEEKLNFGVKQLRQHELKINDLEGELRLTREEVKAEEVLISEVNEEKEILKEKLKAKSETAENLEQELNTTRETLVKSSDETSDLAKQLHESRSICSEIEADAFKVKAEYNEARESLQRDLKRLKEHVKALNSELVSTNEILSKSNTELQSVHQELATAVEERDSLKMKLAEATALELDKEEKITSSLKNELMALQDESLKDKEVRRSLEVNLKETTETLDDMSLTSMKLSKELELANSEMLSLGYEKDALYQALDEQKRTTDGAQQDLEDAHDMVAMLGTETEKLKMKTAKLENDLARAKGEILKLKCESSSKNEKVDHDPVTKVVRRRKVRPQQEK